MRVLVLGSGGQVGSELMRAARVDDLALQGLGHAQLDITDRDTVHSTIRASEADLVVNAAAYTAVDRAEAEKDTAISVNRDGAAFVAEACAERGAALVHLSTDYVFDGSAHAPYKENAAIAPLSVYGRSKAEGEAEVQKRLRHHVILRTAWVYGLDGRNFVKTMLELAQNRSELRVVSDQLGSPTSASELAAAITAIARRIAAGAAPWGLYHFTGAGVISWHGFAQAIFELAARHGMRAPRVIPIGTSDYPTPARRPAYSVLDCEKIARDFGIRPRPWRDALEEMLARYFASTRPAAGR